MPPATSDTSWVTVAALAAVTVSVADAVLLLYMPPVQVRVKVSEPAAVPVTVIVPLTGCVPLHAPLAVQVVPVVADHMSVEGCPATTVVGLKFIDIEVGVIEAGA
jgi:hypothetical protein